MQDVATCIRDFDIVRQLRQNLRNDSVSHLNFGSCGRVLFIVESYHEWFWETQLQVLR